MSKRVKLNGENSARCEIAMMGRVVEVKDQKDVQGMTEYIIKVLKGEEYLEEFTDDVLKNNINKYGENNVKYLVVNKVEGMTCITYLLESTTTDEEDEEYYPAPFTEDYGTGYPCAFCYTLNLDVDYFSELGDCFFMKASDGYFRRVS